MEFKFGKFVHIDSPSCIFPCSSQQCARAKCRFTLTSHKRAEQTYVVFQFMILLCVARSSINPQAGRWNN
jgi:hypothetical protein